MLFLAQLFLVPLGVAVAAWVICEMPEKVIELVRRRQHAKPERVTGKAKGIEFV